MSNIKDNENICKILPKCPKYIEAHFINWKYIFKLLMDSVENYARKIDKTRKGGG